MGSGQGRRLVGKLIQTCNCQRLHFELKMQQKIAWQPAVKENALHILAEAGALCGGEGM